MNYRNSLNKKFQLVNENIQVVKTQRTVALQISRWRIDFQCVWHVSERVRVCVCVHARACVFVCVFVFVLMFVCVVEFYTLVNEIRSSYSARYEGHFDQLCDWVV